MEIKKIGVVGAGMMGAEIALCFAQAGYETVLSDLTPELAQSGKDKQSAILDKQIQKGKLSSEKKAEIMARMTTVWDLGYMTDCDFVIEAVLEVLEIKNSVYQTLDRVCKDSTILASNTSSISITKLAAAVGPARSSRFIGVHFNSPASIMKLVEVIAALQTAEETVSAVLELLHGIGKEPVQVRDVVGFGLNRMFHAFYLEACRLVEEGVCTPEDVDKICLYGLGHPVGVFKLLDNLGNDLNLNVDQILFEAYGDRFRPSPQIQRLVSAGRLGRKSGVGFYDY